MTSALRIPFADPSRYVPELPPSHLKRKKDDNVITATALTAVASASTESSEKYDGVKKVKSEPKVKLEPLPALPPLTKMPEMPPLPPLPPYQPSTLQPASSNTVAIVTNAYMHTALQLHAMQTTVFTGFPANFEFLKLCFLARTEHCFESPEQLKTALEPITKLDTYEQRMATLFATGIGNLEKVFWIKLKAQQDKTQEVFAKVVMTKGKFFSEAIHESCLPQIAEHDHIKVYEALGPEKRVDPKADPFLHIRSCFAHGEWVKLSKGAKISGKEASALYLIFEKVLRVEMYLYDDMQIPVDKQNDVAARFSAIHSNSTFYTRLGFTTIRKCKWKMTELTPAQLKYYAEILEKDPEAKNRNIIQDPDLYATALREVRDLRIGDLYKFYRKSAKRNETTSLKSILNDVFNLPPKTEFSKLEQTVGELKAKVDEAVMKCVPEQRQAALERQLTLQQLIFTRTDVNSIDPTEIKYWHNIGIIFDTRVFVKELREI